MVKIRELDRAAKEFDAFDAQVKKLGQDPHADLALPVQEEEGQTQLTDKQAKKADALYLKPIRSMEGKRSEPNPKFERAHKRGWEYVKCIVENKEIIGESIKVWTKAFTQDPAHQREDPVNTPVYIPRLLAEQLAKCAYTQMKIEENTTREISGGISQYGVMVAESRKQRIECRPVDFHFDDEKRAV